MRPTSALVETKSKDMDLRPYIDHTLLKPTATPTAIRLLCEEAVAHGFFAVCVNGCYVAQARKWLGDSGVKLAAVIGFPLGAMETEAKVFETRRCVELGADEIDMVINLGWLKAGEFDSVREEIAAVKKELPGKNLKVIIETCYLSETEIRRAAQLVEAVGADFVKTSTGFGPGGARPEDVALIKSVIGDQMKIKASGGIRDRATAIAYIEMGVARLGTSSGTVLIDPKNN